MAEIEKKKIILIDANAVMHRAYHAIPPLSNQKGELTNMVYGFSSVILKVIKDIKPDYIASAFDVGGGTFRDEIFKDYKAGRKKPDQEFYSQIPKVKQVLEAMNIPIYEKKGFEADDIIGTLSSFSVKETSNLEVVIVTGDMDALQLVNDKVKVYALRRGLSDIMLYDSFEVKNKYGFGPEKVVDFKSIRGDDSDNIPGIKGIGDKGAKTLLENYESLEDIYETLESQGELGYVNPRVLEKLIAQKQQAFMSKKLATIKTDVEIDFDLEKCRWGDYDKEKLKKVFKELEFFSLLSRLLENEKNVSSEILKKEKKNCKKIKLFEVIQNKDIEKLISDINKYKKFVFKTRENNHKIAERGLAGVVFVFENGNFYNLPVALKKEKQSLFEEKKENDFLIELKPFLENNKIKKIGFDLKSDMENLASYGIWLDGLEFDVMLSAYLLDPGKRSYEMERVIFENFDGEGLCEFSDIKNKENIEPELAHLFHLFDLAEVFYKKMQELDMLDLFENIEIPLIAVLCEIEMNGVVIDNLLLKKISSEVEKNIEKNRDKIYELAGDSSFNINSSQQLADMLFNKMGLSNKDIKKGKNGYSVAASELEKIYDEHEIIEFICKYRELTKLNNTYIKALPKLVNLETGRLHTTFHQTVTSTGRLSSSNPNLQNIPVRTEEGRKIRQAFVVEDGRIMLSADYSQIELRIIATIADDKKMQEIFSKGLDVHAATAAEINQVSLEEVTYEMRRAAKALNFGIIYGMSVFGFAKSAGIEREEAKKFMDSYMEKFSDVAKYLERSKKEATEKGYAETLWGRRRYLPELQSSNVFLRNSAERMAINMPIQGTAADLMKINMIKISDWVCEYNKKNKEAVKVLLQVHDELLFSIKEDYILEVEESVKHIMENGHIEFDGKNIDFAVPIKVDIKKGKNWNKME